MTRRIALCTGGAVVVALLAACVAPQPEPAPPLPPPPHAYRIEQVPMNGGGSYARCTDCAKPTPKTLPGGGERLTAAKQLMPGPADVVPAPPVQPKAKAPRTVTVTLTFDLNSARLTAAAQAELQAVAPIVHQAQQLRVTGFTDDLGSQKLNQKLSDARALTVVLKLRELVAGMSTPPPLSGTGRPLCCFVADNSSEARRVPNRRAEVVITLPDTEAVDRLVRAWRPGDPPRATGAPRGVESLSIGAPTAAVAGIATNTNDEP